MAREREVAWAVRRAGRSKEQVRSEVQALERFLERAWSAHFPLRQGYITVTEPIPGPGEGMRRSVLRGDFRASVDLRCAWHRAWGDQKALTILMHSAAHSDKMVGLERRGHRMGNRLRVTGGLLGLGLFAGMFWPLFGSIQQAALVLMFCFVLLGMLPAAGLAVGAYVAERLTASARAKSLAASSEELQLDYRRWRALARQVALQRRVVARGLRDGPFRREAALAEAG
jgi:hypothetical protein